MLLYTFNLSYGLILCLERMVRKHSVQVYIQCSKHFAGLERFFSVNVSPTLELIVGSSILCERNYFFG